MRAKPGPNSYQLTKLAQWDAKNRAELAAIKQIVPSKTNARAVGLRVQRLKKSVKAAQRYCESIGHERPPLETHEPGDGQ